MDQSAAMFLSAVWYLWGMRAGWFLRHTALLGIKGVAAGALYDIELLISDDFFPYKEETIKLTQIEERV